MSRIVEFGKRNSTTILTIISMAGVIGTAVASGIAVKKVEDKRKEDTIAKRTEKVSYTQYTNREEVKEEGIKEYIKKYWTYYIPAVGIGILTCGCIGMTESINKKRQTALIGACALTAEAFREYRETVKEIYGEEGEAKVQEEIRRKEYEKTDISPEGEELLFYDEVSKRYFNSTMENVKDAIYHFTRNLTLRDYAVINEFYDFLGIDKTEEGEVLGWTTWAEPTYGYKWVDIELEKVTMDDGLECYILHYPFWPHADYLDL